MIMEYEIRNHSNVYQMIQIFQTLDQFQNIDGLLVFYTYYFFSRNYNLFFKK